MNPEIEVRKLSLKPGDVVIVRVDLRAMDTTTHMGTDGIQQYLAGLGMKIRGVLDASGLPNKVVVVPHPIEFMVLSPIETLALLGL